MGDFERWMKWDERYGEKEWTIWRDGRYGKKRDGRFGERSDCNSNCYYSVQSTFGRKRSAIYRILSSATSHHRSPTTVGHRPPSATIGHQPPSATIGHHRPPKATSHHRPPADRLQRLLYYYLECMCLYRVIYARGSGSNERDC